MKSRIKSEIRCDIVQPLLKISQKEIEFSYIWTKNEEPTVQKKEIEFSYIWTKNEEPSRRKGCPFC